MLLTLALLSIWIGAVGLVACCAFPLISPLILAVLIL
jgi:hypothetical protein